MTTHEVLVAARNYIARYGWRQGICDYRRGGPACAVIACGWGTGGINAWPPERSLAVSAVAQVLGLGLSGQVAVWNDAPGRTVEEVLAAFDEAIASTAPEPDVSFVSAESAPPVEKVAV